MTSVTDLSIDIRFYLLSPLTLERTAKSNRHLFINPVGITLKGLLNSSLIDHFLC